MKPELEIPTGLTQRHQGQADILTPANQTEFKDIIGDVYVEDSDERQVHVDPLQAHPSQRDEQEVMKGHCSCNTQPHFLKGRGPGIDQERQV